MPKKKSVKKAARRFIARADELEAFCDHVLDTSFLSDGQVTIAFDGALIKLDAAFEHFMLDALVGALNNDTRLLSSAVGVAFPKHLTDEACEYLVTGGGYFDCGGKAKLIQTLKRFLSDGRGGKLAGGARSTQRSKRHYLLDVVSDSAYATTLDRLFSLRNFAAHESRQSKRAAIRSVGVNISSAGAWLKRQQRYQHVLDQLRKLAGAIEAAAPY